MIDQLFPLTHHGLSVAYIDGGTGSMLLQAALAGLLGGLYVLKTKFAQIRGMVSRLKNRKHSDT